MKPNWETNFSSFTHGGDETSGNKAVPNLCKLSDSIETMLCQSILSCVQSQENKYERGKGIGYDKIRVKRLVTSLKIC